MKIVISKFEPYPQFEPAGVAVGFDLIFNNGRKAYVDTIVDVKEAEEEMLQEAWVKVEDSAMHLESTVGSRPPILGSVWVPGEGIVQIEEEEEEFEDDTVPYGDEE